MSGLQSSRATQTKPTTEKKNNNIKTPQQPQNQNQQQKEVSFKALYLLSNCIVLLLNYLNYLSVLAISHV